MQFNKLINSLLGEEGPSREDRINAMDNLGDPYAAERRRRKKYDEEQAQLKEKARLESLRQEEERRQKWLQGARNKWSSPLFPRVTIDDIINNEPGGNHSIEFGHWDDAQYTAEYNCGEINWDGEDTEIEDWEVVSITANLKNIFGENYYVIISKERNPIEYERLEYKAYKEVVEREGKRLRDEWDGQ